MTIALLKRNSRPVPAELRSNFLHLYLDIAWYGVLSGSAISFAAIYAARLGANGLALGLLTAGPAIVNLLVTLPAGRWLQSRAADRAVFWSALLHRLFYIPWIFLPLLMVPRLEISALILLILLMSVPGTLLSVGFNALFAEAVPPEWRGHVAGVRNGLLAITFTVSTLLSGLILVRVPFAAGYQIVFAIGAVGALMSTLHLAFVHPATTRLLPASGRHVYDLASPGRVRAPWAGLRSSIGLRFLIRRAERQSLLRVDILHGPFGRVVAVLFGFHLAQYLGIPLFPLAMVNELKLSDAEIGLGTGIFYLAVLLGSMQLARISARLGHHRVAALGALALTAYPAILAISDGLGHFLVASLVGGLAWSLFGGALANYVLERAPEDDRAAHLAWYNLSLNAAILIGSMGGAMLGDLVVLPIALLLVACIRLLAALFLWRWG